MRLQKVFLSMLFVAFFLCFHFWIRALAFISEQNKTLCNTGGPFGLVVPSWVFIIGGVMILVGTLGIWLKKGNFHIHFSWILIFSGGLGNLLERSLFGCIMDYIQIPFFPVFNVADVLLTLGTIFVIIRWGKDSTKSQELGIRN